MKDSPNLQTAWHPRLVRAMLALAVACASLPGLAQTSGQSRSPRRITATGKTPPVAAQTSKEQPAATANNPRLVVQLGHAEPIDSAAFSADGRYVVTGSWSEGVAIVWEARTGIEIRRFAGNKRAGGQDGYMAVAFSPDATRIAATSESGLRVFDIATGKTVRRFPLEDVGMDVSFSADGKQVSTAVTTWDLITGQVVRRRPAKQGGELKRRPVFTPDGRFRVESALDPAEDHKKTGYRYKHAVITDTRTGQEVRRLVGHTETINALAVSPDGTLVVTGGDYGDATIRVWDVATGRETGRLQGYSTGGVTKFTTDGLYTMTDLNQSATLREVTTGRETVWGDRNSSGELKSVCFSRDHKVFGVTTDKFAQFVETATGKVLLTAPSRGEKLRIAEFSPDGHYAALEAEGAGDSGEWSTRIWNIFAKEKVKRIARGSNVPIHAAFSPDGKLGATQFYEESETAPTIVLFESDTGTELRRFKIGSDEVTSLAFSPDGRRLAASSGGMSSIMDFTVAQVWDVKTGRELVRLRGHRTTIYAVAWSPDGRLLATGGEDATVRLWDAVSGKELRRLQGHTAPVRTVEFSPDNNFILTRSEDNTERLCRADSGALIARMINLANGDWVIIDNEGRFDTNNLDSIRGLHWVVPDDPLKPLPLEIFMRGYYEPRLLARLMAGEKLPPVPRISSLNRAQPGVRITGIAPQSDGSDQVTVMVEVTSTNTEFRREGQPVRLESGVYDLRLFRDGQLVAYAPEQDGVIKTDGSGKALFTFRNIRLPRRADLKEIEFSAYAFNTDRVKSNTARAKFAPGRPLPQVKGRAYVITVGVNAYENPALNLQFAANDAQRLQSLLTEKIKASAQYGEVIGIPLLADYELQLDGRVVTAATASSEERKKGKLVITAQSATRSNVKTILDLLAGRKAAAANLAGIPNAAQLQPARPEDLVIVSFAGHGYADGAGRFYLVTYDTGPGSKREVTPELLQKSISSDELSLWLRDVDAGEMIMIIDACQSAAAIEGAGFKPGPMGSRGLGQLSWDKGMRILTATQADNVALENKLIRQGLLTYALAHDGIEMGRADFRPADKAITFSEWLDYGVRRVPELYAEIKSGQMRGLPSGAEETTRVIVTAGGADGRLLVNDDKASGKPAASPERQTQQPSLFDFSRRKRDLLLFRKP